jgi:hypothetical protein
MKPGDFAVLRGIGRQKIWYALPVIVVRDSPELVALFWRAGTPGKWRMKPSFEKVSPGDVSSADLEMIDRTWTGTDVLYLVTPGAAHAVYVMWETGQEALRCWYINLQAPLARTPIGFDTTDHWLDIVISPDKTSWQWKDEAQLEKAVELNLVTREKAEAVRREGERVIDRLRENQPPFCDGWETWRAPADWAIPALPPGWRK